MRTRLIQRCRTVDGVRLLQIPGGWKTVDGRWIFEQTSDGWVLSRPDVVGGFSIHSSLGGAVKGMWHAEARR